jgi:uncharacterized protein
MVGATQRAGAAQQAWLGPPASVVAQRLRELDSTWWVVVLVQGPCALAMFMVGHAAGRRRILAQPERCRHAWQRLAPRALALGVAGAVFYATTTVWSQGTGWEVIGLGLSLVTAPFLSFTYVGMAMTLFHRDGGLKIAHALAPAGRMALTNYLLQSLACALIFTGYGLGWMGRVSPAGSVLIALALFGCQMAASAWWLGRFRYGPVEWGLRAVTMATWPAMRKAAASP